MKWSVALFGHEKPRYYVQDEKTKENLYSFVEYPGDMPFGMKLYTVTGWEKRAEPGDFIVAKPERFWNDIDHQQHCEIIKSIRNRKYLMDRKEEIFSNYINSLSLQLRSNPIAYQNALKRFDRLWITMFNKHPKEDRIIGLRDHRWLPEEFGKYFNSKFGSSMFHLYAKDSWGENERKHFLIANIDDLEEIQIEGGTEPFYNIDSYEEYNPKTKNEIKNEIRNNDKIKKKKKDKILEDIDNQYEIYLRDLKDSCAMPKEKLKKRRFKITLDDLESAGVDIENMLDKNIVYDPNPELNKLDLYDKKNSRKVNNQDNLNPLARREF